MRRDRGGIWLATRRFTSGGKNAVRRNTALAVALATLAWGTASGVGTTGSATAAPRGQVAVPDQWTSNSKVWANPDGTASADIYAEAVQAPDPSSATGWSPLDLTLGETADGLEPGLADATIQFSTGIPSDPLATVGRNGASLSVGWTGTASTPTVQGDTASYPGVLTGIDATVRAKAYGFEESFIVDSASDAPETLDIPLLATAMTPTITSEGDLVFTDSAWATVATATRPMMWGAATDLELTRFRGDLQAWGSSPEGSQHGRQDQTALPAGVSG